MLKFLRDEGGQTVVEYMLITAVIMVVVVVSGRVFLGVTSEILKSIYSRICEFVQAGLAT
jgi:Flp pilus assembly pilin Flp